jgi:hypothetical protein
MTGLTWQTRKMGWRRSLREPVRPLPKGPKARASGDFLLHPGTMVGLERFCPMTEGSSNGPTLAQPAFDLGVHGDQRNRFRPGADRAIGSTGTNRTLSALSQSHRPVRPNGTRHALLLFSRAPTPSCTTFKHTPTHRNSDTEAPIAQRSRLSPLSASAAGIRDEYPRKMTRIEV